VFTLHLADIHHQSGRYHDLEQESGDKRTSHPSEFCLLLEKEDKQQERSVVHASFTNSFHVFNVLPGESPKPYLDDQHDDDHIFETYPLLGYQVTDNGR
jgi:hypothetical protein